MNVDYMAIDVERTYRPHCEHCGRLPVFADDLDRARILAEMHAISVHNAPSGAAMTIRIADNG